MVEPHRSNFRVITTNVLSVRILGNLRYTSTNTVCVGGIITLLTQALKKKTLSAQTHRKENKVTIITLLK